MVSYFDDLPDDASNKRKVVLIKNFDFETGEIEYEEYDNMSELKKSRKVNKE